MMDKVQHFEIPSENIDEAQEFYKNVFGWKMKDVSLGEDWKYVMVHTGKTDKKGRLDEKAVINGALMEKKTVTAPVLVITVASIDNKVKQIKEQGGTITLEKTDVEDMGKYARFKDRDGNELGLWENN